MGGIVGDQTSVIEWFGGLKALPVDETALRCSNDSQTRVIGEFQIEFVVRIRVRVESRCVPASSDLPVNDLMVDFAT